MYLSLIQNAALLVALSTLYGLLARLRRDDGLGLRLLSGLLFGGMAVAAMLLPFHYQPGIIYDGRSIILAMAGLFGGGAGSVVSIVVAGAYRAYLGGPGVWAGLATIVFCSMVGLAFRRAYGNRPEKLSILSLYLLGIAAHVVMLACQLLLPWSRSLDVIGRVWLPIMLVFPVATALIGLLLGNEVRRIQTARELRESSERFKGLVGQLNAVVWTASADGKTLRDVNQAFEDIYGASTEEFKADPGLWLEMVHPDDRLIAERSSEELRDIGRSQAEYRITRPDGEIRWLRDRKSMIYDERGRPSAMGGLIADITESKEAEENLRLTQFSVDHAVDSVFWTDCTGRLLYVSDSTCTRLGYSRDELLSMTLFELNPTLTAAQWAENWNRLKHEGALALETTHRNSRGEILLVEVNLNYLEYEDKAYNCVFARDISERKKAEESLRESEERFRRVITKTKAGYFLIDRDGRFLHVNDAWLKIHGYESAGEVIGRHFSLAQVEDDLPASEHIVQTVLAGGYVADGEFSHRCRDGSVGYHTFTLSPIVEDGEILGLEGFLIDITDQKRAEEDYRTLFREMLDGFAMHEIICDENGHPVDYRFLAVNPAFESVIGRKAEDIVGHTVLEVLPGTERHWIETYGKVALTGIPAFFENYAAPLDRHFQVTAFQPAPYQFACIFADITERKRAEAALRERDEQLRQSQKMEAVGQLAGGIAHDFNNLLTAIIGYSDLVLADKATQGLPLQEDVAEIKHAAERAAALTRQILAFSRRQALRPALASLNATLLGMEQLLRRTLGEDIELVTLPHPDLGLTEVDVNQFEQVLMNLAINARDAMPLGGRLTLETANVELGEEYCGMHSDTPAGSYVMLSVSDTGLGMDKETESHIFEPFFTTKPPGEGTGLGLSTVYGIVKQSGGSIDVHSEPGQGTSFKVYLPQVTQSGSVAPVSVAVTSSTRGRETVLVVEDEESLRGLAARILGELGYTVLCAATAGEALELLATNDGPVDLLVADVVLPGGMQGNDLAQMLTASRPDLPVLYMSGYPRDAIVHAGRLDEGVNYLEKPFTPEALAIKVREVLSQARPLG